MRTLLGMFVCLALATGLPAARAEGPADPAADSGGLVLVLDASGSMNDPAAGGTKIQVAKKALRETVAALPDDARVGMRVFGATVEFASQPGACTDTQNVVPVDTLDRPALNDAIDAYQPLGETPIGNALKGAGEDLANETGKRTIVLVSDGEPTCAPDPCKVARNLAAQGIDLRIDVVGLDVAGMARQALQCIAAAGGGTYYDADDAGDLADSLDQFSQRAFRPFGFTGEPVKGKVLDREIVLSGGADQDGAFDDVPEITQGLWLDTLSERIRPTLYRIPRTQDGSVIHLGATAAGRSGLNVSSIAVTLVARVDDDLELCASESGSAVSIAARNPLVSVSASTWTSAEEDPCAQAEEIYAAVVPGRGSTELTGKPVEVAVYEEPPLADAAVAHPVAEAQAWTSMTPAAEPVGGTLPGASLAEAPVLEDGTYQLDINGGETQVFAVPLDWGQRLQAQVDMPINARVRGADQGIESGVKVTVLGPLRDTPDGFVSLVEPNDWTGTAFANLWTDKSITNFRTGAMTPTLAYGNRAASASDVRSHTLPGLRYVEVDFSLREPLTVPYTLTVAHYDDDSVAAPDYRDVLPAPEADSPLALPPGADDEGAAGGEGAERDGADDTDGLPGWVIPVAAGASGLVLLAGGALAVWRWRRRSSS